MPWQCFMLEPANRVRRSLRRYVPLDKGKCPLPYGYHDASAPLDEVADDGRVAIDDSWPHDDPRWPTHCACGYAFQPDDTWQLFRDHLFRRADTGELVTLRDAPPGAMWEAAWMVDHITLDELRAGRRSSLSSEWKDRCLSEGRIIAPLVLRLPGGGEWVIMQRASNGAAREDGYTGGWTWDGSPPRITARPSILVPGYHGWLTDGVLSDDLEGRTY